MKPLISALTLFEFNVYSAVLPGRWHLVIALPWVFSKNGGSGIFGEIGDYFITICKTLCFQDTLLHYVPIFYFTPLGFKSKDWSIKTDVGNSRIAKQQWTKSRWVKVRFGRWVWLLGWVGWWVWRNFCSHVFPRHYFTTPCNLNKKRQKPYRIMDMVVNNQSPFQTWFDRVTYFERHSWPIIGGSGLNRFLLRQTKKWNTSSV